MASIDLTKISTLPAYVAPLTGNELLPLVQAGNTSQAPARAFVLPGDPLLLFASNSYLINSRVLTAGAGVIFNLATAGQFIISIGAGGTGPIVYGNRITAAMTGASQDDFNPAGWDAGLDKNGLTVAPFAGGGTLTGIDTSAMVDGQDFKFVNSSDVDNLTLKHEDAGSAANNRFHLPLVSDMVLVPSQMIMLMFDASINRLRATL